MARRKKRPTVDRDSGEQIIEDGSLPQTLAAWGLLIVGGYLAVDAFLSGELLTALAIGGAIVAVVVLRLVAGARAGGGPIYSTVEGQSNAMVFGAGTVVVLLAVVAYLVLR